MKLATIAAVLLVLTCAAWVAMEMRKDASAEKQCHALQETVTGLNGALEFIAERAFQDGDADALRARKVRRPTC